MCRQIHKKKTENIGKLTTTKKLSRKKRLKILSHEQNANNKKQNKSKRPKPKTTENIGIMNRKLTTKIKNIQGHRNTTTENIGKLTTTKTISREKRLKRLSHEQNANYKKKPGFVWNHEQKDNKTKKTQQTKQKHRTTEILKQIESMNRQLTKHRNTERPKF